jgi:hypothetical protein
MPSDWEPCPGKTNARDADIEHALIVAVVEKAPGLGQERKPKVG